MRIVAGKYKGLNFDTVSGKNVRPTTNRMREALFSSLFSIYGDLDGANVLDCFCGSGALSFESISRGADCSYMFEKDSYTCKIIKNSIRKLNFEKSCFLKNSDVFYFNFKQINNLKFNIVFLDPPYDLNCNCIVELLINITNNKLLEENAVLVYEHASNFDIELYKQQFEDLGFMYIKTKKHSTSKCEFFRFMNRSIDG